jgi:hypothetical protein
LRTLLFHRHVLVVVDDAWSATDLQPFIIGSASCKVLVTSREIDVVQAIGSQVVSAGVMTAAEAALVLRRTNSRASEPSAQLDELATELGYLPLALDLASRRLAEGYPLDKMLLELKAEMARLDALDRGNAGTEEDESLRRNLSLNASFNLSLRLLPTDHLHAFARLGAATDDAVITPEFASVLWDVDPTTARQWLLLLWGKSLLQRAVGSRESELAFSIHDLLHSKARVLLHGNQADSQRTGLACLSIPSIHVHRHLVERYRLRLQSQPWHRLQRDGYIEANLFHHLERSESYRDLLELFGFEEPLPGQSGSANGWYQFRERSGEAHAFMGDLARAQGLAKRLYEANRSFPEAGEYLGYAVQLGAFLCSVSSLGSSITPPLVELLLGKGLWSTARVLAHGRRNMKPGDLAALAVRVGGAAGEEMMAAALWKAEGALDLRIRLNGLFEILDARQEGALDIAKKIQTTVNTARTHFQIAVGRDLSDWDTLRLSHLGAYVPACVRLCTLDLSRNDVGAREMLEECVRFITKSFSLRLFAKYLGLTKGNEAQHQQAWKKECHACHVCFYGSCDRNRPTPFASSPDRAKACTTRVDS